MNALLIDTPSGSGAVKHSGVMDWSVAYAVNPYMWYRNFKKAGKKETIYPLPPGVKEWIPKIGEEDPLFKAQ